MSIRYFRDSPKGLRQFLKFMLAFTAAGSATGEESWRAVEEPGLKSALDYAPVLQTEWLFGLFHHLKLPQLDQDSPSSCPSEIVTILVEYPMFKA